MGRNRVNIFSETEPAYLFQHLACFAGCYPITEILDNCSANI